MSDDHSRGGDAGPSRLVSLPAQDVVEFSHSLTVGRHLDNGLVLSVPRISSRHAVIEWTHTGWHVRDLGSRNGTSVNGRRIRGWKVIRPGDKLRFGGVSTWLVERLLAPQPIIGSVACLENVDSGRRVAVDADRFLIGTSSPADLLVEEWTSACESPLRVVLYLESERLWVEAAADIPDLSLDGAPWDGRPMAIERGRVVQMGLTRLRVVPRVQNWTVDETEFEVARTKPYDLEIHLAFDTADSGTIRTVYQGREWRVRAGQRFILLYLLATARGEWVPDEDLRLRIWGRTHAQSLGRNALNKLIYDTRQMFLARGIDGWFLEKRRGATRLRLPADHMHVDSSLGSTG